MSFFRCFFTVFLSRYQFPFMSFNLHCSHFYGVFRLFMKVTLVFSLTWHVFNFSAILIALWSPLCLIQRLKFVFLDSEETLTWHCLRWETPRNRCNSTSSFDPNTMRVSFSTLERSKLLKETSSHSYSTRDLLSSGNLYISTETSRCCVHSTKNLVIYLLVWSRRVHHTKKNTEERLTKG